MYTKTQWVDNTTPIDKDNLNKIEQGIYDNSLVVDAVTNTINPTDTETYKTAEITEGQITDVIGVNDIVIKGQTEQDGTPTPSAPVDVNVVSGSNVINTSNKNLFIPTLIYNNRQINQNNCTITLNKDEFEFTASGTDMYFGYIGSTGTTFANTYGVLYKVLNNKTIRFTLTNTTFNKNYIVKYDKDKKILGYQQFNSNSGTITFTDDVKYYSFRIGYGSAVSGTIYKTKIQVEQGSTATTYEPHQGKELPLDLGTIELCKIGDYQDYFYKSGSKWYLHKEVNKITSYNGETITTSYISTTGKLSTGAKVYYVVNSTNIEITDTTLISQLEAIYNAPLYEQTNITQENNDLPMVLDITACKDNINGIKAFIRK